MANSVPNPVQRLRYFDGEYLRSYDFTDEQSYHIEMRRLMNRKLHLHGVVYGLELVQDEDSISGGPYFFSISPGVAIDKMGREIIVPAPYSLSNILDGPGLGAGRYEVWICYQESETGLPAAGYLDCNVKNQSTRWQETFLVQLVPTQGPSLAVDCGGVRLGSVKLKNPGMVSQIENPVYNVGRHYVGIRAQSIIAPDQVDADPFDITAMTTPIPDKSLPGYLDVHPPAFHHSNVVVKKNLVVGDDFVLNSSDSSAPGYSPSLPGLSSSTTGDVKITGDMFLQGNFYGFNPSAGSSGQWQELQQLIQSFLPQIVSGSITITPPAVSDAGPMPSASAIISSNQFPSFPAGGSTQVLLSVSETDWQDQKILHQYWKGPSGIVVSVSDPAVGASGSPGYSVLNLTWTVSPVADVVSASQWQFPVTKLVVGFVVIYQP